MVPQVRTTTSHRSNHKKKLFEGDWKSREPNMMYPTAVNPNISLVLHHNNSCTLWLNIFSFSEKNFCPYFHTSHHNIHTNYFLYHPDCQTALLSIFYPCLVFPDKYLCWGAAVHASRTIPLTLMSENPKQPPKARHIMRNNDHFTSVVVHMKNPTKQC